MSESTLVGRYDGGAKSGTNKALLVIDVQNEYFDGKLKVSYPQNSFENILTLMSEAKNKNIPIIVIQHTLEKEGASAFVKGTRGWELHDKIKEFEYDFYVEKTLPSSFVGTDLHKLLDENGIDTVVISGYMTQFCCDTTAKYAMHLGYNVEFISDATGTLSFENNAGKVSAEQLHTAILVQQAARFSKVMTTKEWIITN